jgi:hypothetical protein
MKARLELVYHELARRMLLRQTDDEIGQHMGLKTQSVKRIQDNPQFREVLESLRDKSYQGLDRSIENKAKSMIERITEAADESYDRLRVLLKTSSSEQIVRDVAQDFMDRAGYGKATPTNQTTVNIGSLEASVLMDALRREREARELQDGKDPKNLAKPITEHVESRDAKKNLNG